jgi:serine/threonine-protein kinase
MTALIDKVVKDGFSSLGWVVVAVLGLTVIAVLIGVARHHKVLTSARMGWVAAIITFLGVGFFLGQFLQGGDEPPPWAGGPPSASVPVELPPSSVSHSPSPPPTPTVSPTSKPSISPSPKPSPSSTPERAPTEQREVIASGSIAAPAAGSGVQKCAFVTGTAQLPAGKTLILAVRNLDNDESDRWYTQFPRGWNDPSTLSAWTGVEYFPGDSGQHYEIGLFAVNLKAAMSAANDRSRDALVQGATPLDTRQVVQREGGSGSDCD